MAICPKCGSAVGDGSRFCVTCGAALSAPVAPPAPEPQQAYTQQSYQQPCQQPYTQPQQTVYAPPPVVMDQDTRDNRVLSLFCYLGIFMILPLVAQPNSSFVRFHANQGLVLILFTLCATVINIIPILGWIVSIVCYIFSLVCTIIGIVNACKGRKKSLPLIGKYTILH